MIPGIGRVIMPIWNDNQCRERFHHLILFLIFFFDLDGKFLFYVVEPFLKNHYDKMPRRDVTKQDYKIGNL